MQLTKLDIFGFKSFANKVTLKFDDGLTGIIGPNGCGKSNVVDAIRWVLGEQRPSVLRCDRMENIIFNGTATRKPLNVAEVSMFIENNKKVLPTEYTELKLTRRLYRSGESEYLINNQVVRLKDIVDLFADTGMGADAYSVIELKMVEQILSDNAQERRRLFEEAAGIKKYKVRRKSALNKLDTTQQELTRVDDILAEVQKTVNSLSRQVGKARRYHELKNQLRESELLLSYLKIIAYENELGPLETEVLEVRHSGELLGTEVHKMEAELEKLHVQSVEMEQRYRQKAAALYQKDEAIGELQNRKKLRQQRIESLVEGIASFREEIGTQNKKIQHLISEKGSLENQIAQLQKEINAAQEKYRVSANEQLGAENHHQQIRSQYQSFVQSNLQELQASAGVKENFQKIRLEKESLSERMEKSRDTLARIADELKSRRESLETQTASLAEAREDLEMYHKEYTHLETGIEALKQTQDQLRSEINSAEGQLEKKRSRKDFLENLINNYEGFSQSVQYIMSRKRDYNGVVDTLANMVDCDAEFRPALESYLAEVSNYLVVDAVDTAQEILKHLRSEEKGRLTVVPLPLLNSDNHAPLKLPSPNGKTISLKQVVNYPAEYEKLFNFLFQSVYLVPDLETAIEIRKEFPGVTYVTRDGEILEHWGNLTGGSSTRQVGLIGRKEQYEKLLKSLAELDAQLQIKKSQLQEVAETIVKKDSKLREFSQLQKSAQSDLVELEKTINRQSYEVERLQESLADLRAETATQDEKLQTLSEQENALLPEIQKLAAKAAAYQAQEKALLEKQQAAETNLKELTQQTQAHQISYLNLSSKEKEMQQRIQFVSQNIAEAEQFIKDRELRIVDNDAQIKALREECERIEKDLEKMYRERDAAEKEKNDTERQFNELKGNIQNTEANLKKKQRMWNQARERVQELELRIKEYQVKLGSVRELVTENYGAEALKFEIKALDPSRSLTDVHSEIEDIRTKIQRLGDVNPLAVKEYEKEKERLDFLTTQREDLLTARDQLVETIEKLNKTARKQFIEVFEQIQLNFQRVFQEFFEGGKAELLLVESQDPLEANIDISVIHKGKQLKTLSLLSAGEKTLTAISMLFSIYLVKPSPFCILDEVDAPLDDINISRLAKALNLFSRDTQFILVTHNKKTMEATRSIYGVTMEEIGVSKLVSVRFD